MIKIGKFCKCLMLTFIFVLDDNCPATYVERSLFLSLKVIVRLFLSLKCEFSLKMSGQSKILPQNCVLVSPES